MSVVHGLAGPPVRRRAANRWAFSCVAFAKVCLGCPSAGGQRVTGLTQPRCAVAAHRSSRVGHRAECNTNSNTFVRQGLHGLSVRWRPAHRRVAATALRCSCSKIGARIKRAVNSKHKQPLVEARLRQSFCSLALRNTAAPLRKVGSGTGFARAAEVAPLRHQVVSKGGRSLAHWAIVHGRRPNPSVERTSNGGPRWFASQRSATPLAATHLKR